MKNIGNVVKSIQNIMWKDPGVSGDAQRIEQLGWMLFLKILDDNDKELELLQKKYQIYLFHQIFNGATGLQMMKVLPVMN